MPSSSDGQSSGVVSARADSVDRQPGDRDVTVAASATSPSKPNASLPIPDGSKKPEAVKPAAPKVTVKSPLFYDAAQELGLDFQYDNGAAGKVLMVESIGGGVGWLDFDGDLRWDLYLPQGGNPAAPPGEIRPTDEIFRQTETGRFERVTLPARVQENNYSVGLSVADFDDDGFDDVFITNVGRDTLLKNLGDGTFLDVTEQAGVGNMLWGSSSAWSDLDGDGDLDLYVCNYLDYDPYHPMPCMREDGRPSTCHPADVPAVPDEVYMNQGDGTFTPEAQQRGLFGSGNKGLGVVIADLNNDGLRDIYVANDTTPNFLFVNQGNGQFQESAQLLGCAVSREGLAQASMGVGFGDFDRNGWMDLYCTHFTYESNTLYKNLGSNGFQDVTGFVGLHSPTLAKLAFGTVMLDLNQDGHDDLFIANGHIDDWQYKGEAREMNPQLFSYQGPRFVEWIEEGGPYFQRKLIGRGVAQCDFDDDGDWDLAVVHQDAPVSLLQNESQRGHWLKLRFCAFANRRGIGTRVVLKQGNQTLVQELAGGTSFCAAHQPALIFGLGEETAPCQLSILWPDGTHQEVDSVGVDQALVITQTELPTDARSGS